MEKFTREIDGKTYVGVLISRGFGAGWSTWNGMNPCDSDFLQFLTENGEIGSINNFEWEIYIEQSDVEDYFASKKMSPYCGGTDGFVIEWLEEGTRFRINEYDGAESIEIFDPDDYMTA